MLIYKNYTRHFPQIQNYFLFFFKLIPFHSCCNPVATILVKTTNYTVVTYSSSKFLTKAIYVFPSMVPPRPPNNVESERNVLGTPTNIDRWGEGWRFLKFGDNKPKNEEISECVVNVLAMILGCLVESRVGALNGLDCTSRTGLSLESMNNLFLIYLFFCFHRNSSAIR